MPKINRRQLLAFASTIIPGFLLSKMDSASAFSLDKAAASSIGVKVTKSSSIQVGQTQIFTGKSIKGMTVQVVLTRTPKGLFALDGICTHQGCSVTSQADKLVCPCHGSVFTCDTGVNLFGPNGSTSNLLKPLAKFKATEKGGYIYIK